VTGVQTCALPISAMRLGNIYRQFLEQRKRGRVQDFWIKIDDQDMHVFRISTTTTITLALVKSGWTTLNIVYAPAFEKAFRAT